MDSILQVLNDLLAFFKKFATDREYEVAFEQFNPGQGSSIQSKCNTIGFKNQGTSTVWINNTYRIDPGQPYSVDGNQREKDTTTYNLTFDDSTGTIRSLVIIRKILK